MADKPLGFLADSEFWGYDIPRHAKNALAGGLAALPGAPVDIASMALRPFGYSVPPEQVVGSTEWWGQKAGAETESPAFFASQFISPDPTDAVKLGGLAGMMLRKADDIPDAVKKVKPEQIVQKPQGDAININLEKIDSPDAVKDVIANTAATFEGKIQGARRGTITVQQTSKLADELGLTAEELAKRKKGVAFNAEQVMAARQVLVSSAQDLQGKAKAAVGGSDDQLIAFQKALARHSEIQAQVSGITAEAGRALRIFRESAGPAPDVKEILETFGGRGRTEDIAKALSQVGDPQNLNRLTRELTKAKPSDKLLELWINGLLSGPTTHAVNTMSNTLTALLTVPEHAVAAGLGKLTRNSDKVYFREVAPRAFGFVQGARDGLKAGYKAFLSEEPSDLMSKIELPRQAAIGGKTGKIVRIPGRALQAEDEFFKSIGYRMELNSLATREGIQKGLNGDELAAYVTERTMRPTDEMMKKALDAARYQTFTKPLGEFGAGFQRWVNSHPAMRVIAPFIRTPGNIVKFAAERTPVGYFMKEVKTAIKKGGADAQLAHARIMVGSGIAGLAAWEAANGRITGGGPSDPKLKAQLYNTGWQPYSIKIGDEYYAYSRLEPLGMLLGISADFAEIQSSAAENENDAVAGQIIASFAKNITSKTWLRGFSELIEAFSDPDRYGERFLQNYAGTLIPTGVAQYARSKDPILRQTEDTVDAIKARIPGVSESLPPRLNIWGEPITLSGAYGPDLISPIYHSKRTGDVVSEKLVELKINPGLPKRTISMGGQDIELDAEQYNRYVRMAGAPAKKILEKLVSAPGFDQMPEEQQEEMINRVLRSTRSKALQQIKMEVLRKQHGN